MRKQGFVSQIKVIHIFLVDLLFAEITFKTSTSELAMALPYTLKRCRFNINNVEITIAVPSSQIPNIHVVGIYR